jgi:hypothetical protein
MASRPRLTYAWLGDREAPACPHCREAMDAATLSMDALVLGWPISTRIETHADGYARPHVPTPQLTCPYCRRVSAIAIDALRIKLIACRSKADLRYLETRKP